MKKLLIFAVFIVIVVACEKQKPGEVSKAEEQVSTDSLPPLIHGCKIYVDITSFQSVRYDQFEWRINGVSVKLDSALTTFDVPVHEGFDTVVFRNEIYKKSEIILCDLQLNQEYLINYNACCGDFYFWIRDNKKRGRSEFVSFTLTSKSFQKLIGGVLPAASFLKLNKEISVEEGFHHSPMRSNRYEIIVQQYQPESPDSTMCRIIDPVSQKEIMPFKLLDDKLFSFNYIFLKNDSLKITVDGAKFSASVEKTNKLNNE